MSLNDQTLVLSRENKLRHSYGVSLDSLQLISAAGCEVAIVLPWILQAWLSVRVYRVERLYRLTVQLVSRLNEATDCLSFCLLR
jgi:hypothetical protein